jgi:hypothetical protein
VKAIVRGRDITTERVAAYLPSNYSVIDEYDSVLFGHVVVIEGEDRMGWTFNDYVAPRLASGLMFASEVIEEVTERDNNTESEG